MVNDPKYDHSISLPIGEAERLVAPRPMLVAWRPIETAPKTDGEFILLYDKELDHYAVGEWWKIPEHRDGGEWWDGESPLFPTHWMPLPEPPHG